MKKVLYFEPSSGKGGSSNSLRILLNNLNKEKFFPLVVVNRQGAKFE